MQAGKLKYVTVFLVISVVFFFFDLADDVIERVLAKSGPTWMDLLHLLFELCTIAALILAIRIMLRQMAWLQEQNDRQSQSLRFLRGEMDSFVGRKFDEWQLTPAERDIAMYMLKGLSVADIAAARSTAEGTVKAQTSNIFRKTGVASRMELMSLFMDEFLDIGAGLTDQTTELRDRSGA